MDDAKIAYAKSDAELDGTLATIRGLGADRIRVSLYWRLVAPNPDGRERPAFAADDPAAYAPEAWDRYDRVVLAARRHGLEVLFTLTGPAPLWATGAPAPAENAAVFRPSAEEFGRFVTAVGRRYSGSYPDEPASAPGPPPPGPDPLPLPLSPGASAAQEGDTGALPRVDAWSVWNEGNQPGWLGPQWAPGPGGRLLPSSAHIYRALVDAAWAGLGASGHGRDAILIGETAPRGQRRSLDRPMTTLEFVRELYCLDRRLRPLAGEAAAGRGCPATAGARRSFAAAHPGLFRARGFAHHPYALKTAPRRSDRVRDNVALADLKRLTRTLDRALRRHGSRRRLPIWITEYGYQTTPPDPTVGISWRRQAAWLAEGEYLAYRNRRVASFTQFLLVDDQPRSEFPASDPRHWGSFQTGLISLDGRPKLAFETWARPFHVTPARVRRGQRVTVFGALRPAAARARLSARLELLRRGSRRWRKLRTLRTRSSRGYVSARVRLPRGGRLRLAWRDPAGGGVQLTREVAVTVR